MSAQVIQFPQRRDEQGRVYEPWVNEPDLARHFGVSTRTVRRWRESGMPSRLMGSARRYRIGECEDWLASTPCQ